MKGYILRDSNYDDLERAKLATAESGRCWGVWGARRGARRQPGASGGAEGRQAAALLAGHCVPRPHGMCNSESGL